MKKVHRLATARARSARPPVALMLGVTLALALALLAAPCASQAADLNAINHATRIASSVGVGTAAPKLGVGAVLQTLMALAVVVSLVFVCAWLARRLGLQSSARGNVVKAVGSLSLGGKERVAVVEVGDTWLVLGTAPGNVRLLHTLPAGSAALPPATPHHPGSDGSADAAYASLPGTFGSRFRAALAAEAKKRFSRPSGGGK